MRLARKLGMITYRSSVEWQSRFGRERVSQGQRTGDPFGIDFEIEAYLEAKANRFVGQFDANCYLYISRAVDLFDLAEHGGSVAAALKRSNLTRALIIGVETDLLFPLAAQRELAEGLQQAGVATQFSVLASIQGHDSFLVDMDRFRPAIGDFLAQL
jgi:homoserine O-acetyltransferase